jgi:transglutaminase/protease-like cytokinesis protein 3
MSPVFSAMKWLLVIFVLASLPVFSQKNKTDFSEIDRRVQSVDAATPFLLAQQLTAECSTDLQKTRAIFRWITDNIAYRTKETVSRKRKSRITEDEETDDTTLLKPLDERVAETVMANKVAVCDGYARLFKTLCNYAGLQAEVITGYGKTEPHKIHQRFRNNHSWNAVMIDSVWQLLDVTWASGYITWQGDRFIRQLDEQYFLTPPDVFIREHYPDDLRWSLVDDPPLMAEFRLSPFKQKSFIKYNIISYKPVKGIIEADLNDTVQIVLETSDFVKDRNISSDPFLDTSIYSTARSALLVAPGMISSKTIYTYHVTTATIQWLYILYNDDIVLRYKLVVKDNGSGVATSK